MSQHTCRSSARPLICWLLPALLTAGCMNSADTPEVAMERGRILAERQQFEEAIPHYSRAIEGLPENGEAYYLRGVAYENLGLPEKALADYTESVKLDPTRVDAMNNQGVVLAKLEKYQDAIDTFTRLLDISPDHGLALRNRALSRQDLGKTDEALIDYGKAIEREPKEPVNYLQRGNIYLEKNQLTEAEADYSRAIDLNAQFARAWVNRGIARYRQGKKAEGLKDLRHAETLDENIILAGVELLEGDEAFTPPDSAVAAAPPAAAQTPEYGPAGSTIPEGDDRGESAANAGGTQSDASVEHWSQHQNAMENILAEKGFTNLRLQHAEPVEHFAVLTGQHDGHERLIVLATADHGQNEDHALEPGVFTIRLPGSLLASADSSADPQTSEASELSGTVLLVAKITDKTAREPEILLYDEHWHVESAEISPVVIEARLERDTDL